MPDRARPEDAIGAHSVGPHRAGPDRARAVVGPGGPFGILYPPVRLQVRIRFQGGCRVPCIYPRAALTSAPPRFRPLPRASLPATPRHTGRRRSIVPSRSGGNPKHKSPSNPAPGWQRCAPGPRTASPAARSSWRTAACELRPSPYRLPAVQCKSKKAGFLARLTRLLRRVGGTAGAGFPRRPVLARCRTSASWRTS
jgi:hypothetical protein